MACVLFGYKCKYKQCITCKDQLFAEYPHFIDLQPDSLQENFFLSIFMNSVQCSLSGLNRLAFKLQAILQSGLLLGLILFGISYMGEHVYFLLSHKCSVCFLSF